MCLNRTVELSCSCSMSCFLLLQESCHSLLTRGFIVMHTLPVPMWSALFRTCWTTCPGMFWIIPLITHNLHFVACMCLALLKKVLKAQRLSLNKDSGVVAHWLWQQQSTDFSVKGSVVRCVSGFPNTCWDYCKWPIFPHPEQYPNWSHLNKSQNKITVICLPMRGLGKLVLVCWALQSCAKFW
jgi:hypothetical protein